MLNPHKQIVRKANEKLYTPEWEENTKVDLRCFIGFKARRKDGMPPVWETSFSFGTNMSKSLEYTVTNEKILERLEMNKNVYMHFELRAKGSVVKAMTPLVKMMPHIHKRPVRRLLEDFEWLKPYLPEYTPPEWHRPASVPSSVVRQDMLSDGHRIGYWKPHVSIHLVADWTEWPARTTPRTVLNFLKSARRELSYLPVAYTDQLGMTRDELVQVNGTMMSKSLPLKISVSAMSLARWQFNAHMEESIKLQRKMGFPEKDTDDIRHMLVDTNPVLLAVTMIVSMLHLLFDVLAMKNEVQFWRGIKSMAGLSSKTVGVNFFCSLIITAYLYDEGASLLVVVPSALGVLIQLWKWARVASLNRAMAIAPEAGSGSDEKSGVERATRAFDTVAFKYMGILLGPVVLGFSLYSLVFKEYASFYSWILGSLTGAVYTFGFIMMTPQLYINYKVKSVAHLPWKFLIYRSLNTFIDDLFAFIIRMPTMHRAACFRDDIVFFVYIYQRWIYPVDNTRKSTPGGGDMSTPSSGENEAVGRNKKKTD